MSANDRNGCALADVVVTGTGAVCGACDAGPYLRIRKLRKFMGKQDALAVVAAARAVGACGLVAPLGERCGLYAAVGYIPFETADINRLLDASLDREAFSMERFAANAFGAINPLLTFRVLPNMPAFHVSLNLDIQGPYAVSYPGIGQFYSVLEEGIAAIESGLIDIALVGAVADQRNFLVEHHFSRIAPPVEPDRLADGAAFIVIERRADAIARGATPRARLLDYRLDYSPVDPFAGCVPSECLARDGVCVKGFRELGPATLAVALAETERGRVTHSVRTRDGFSADSVWEVT
jgi:3-oxoacyl-(acyl-carrier-protein) synthase